MLKLKKLDAHGITHYLVLLGVIVLVGLVGTYMLVASHADNLCSSADSLKGTCKNAVSSSSCQAGQAVTRGHCQPVVNSHLSGYPDSGTQLHQVAKKTPSTAAKPKAKPAATATSASQTADSSVAVPVASSASAPAAAPVTRSYATVKKVDPNGDIVVVSYVHDPSSSSDQDQRVGGVAVKITRAGGNLGCTPLHKNGTGKTTEAQKINGKFVHGTINFLNCNVGDYKVTTTGRSGYKVISGPKPASFHLSNNENQRVEIHIQKK